eukprot:jgi/Galph1/6082/GphlegSOOS_G4720.1
MSVGYSTSEDWRRTLERDDHDTRYSFVGKDGLEERDEQTQLLAELEELDRQRRELEAKLQEVDASSENKQTQEETSHAERSKRLKSTEPRDKKMFGLLLGTLKAAKEELATTENSEKMRQRQELEKKAMERLNEVKQQVLEQQSKLQEKRKKLKEELILSKRLVRLRSELKQMQEFAKVKARFLWTKTEPSIRWCPRQVDHDFLKPLWEESKMLAAEECKDKTAKLQGEISLLEEELLLKKSTRLSDEREEVGAESTVKEQRSESFAAMEEEELESQKRAEKNDSVPVVHTVAQHKTEEGSSSVEKIESEENDTLSMVDDQPIEATRAVTESELSVYKSNESNRFEDLSKLTVKELRSELQKRGIEDKHLKLKKELVETLKANLGCGNISE